MTDETERPAIVEVSPGGVGFIRTDARKPTLAGMPHASRKAWVEGETRTNDADAYRRLMAEGDRLAIRLRAIRMTQMCDRLSPCPARQEADRG